MKKRIMLTIAYDGTGYSGWQIQPGEPTIEGVLNAELSRLLNEDIHVTGASRTDAGVHALGAVAVFDTASSIPGDKFSFALNQSLPDDIRVMSSKQVADDFHPRKVPCRKTYEYRIYNDTFMPPTRRLYAHHVYGPLDEKLMNEAAQYLVGEHDFTSFSSAGGQALTSVRTIYELSVRREASPLGRDDKEVVITVTGNGFLYNMVRIIAGTLIEVGQGKYPPEEVKAMLEAKDRSAAGQTAPACGLCLMGYDF
ncbi:MAG: tRNA pseudouridine(38-40) synthase TruA [Lachnospiraceae bacterium]|nr:tRNA pseudouridine(38-40) synthase TruA [Lachnospiraceae bacterium]